MRLPGAAGFFFLFCFLLLTFPLSSCDHYSDSSCQYAFFRIFAENVGNTGKVSIGSLKYKRVLSPAFIHADSCLCENCCCILIAAHCVSYVAGFTCCPLFFPFIPFFIYMYIFLVLSQGILTEANIVLQWRGSSAR